MAKYNLHQIRKKKLKNFKKGNKITINITLDQLAKCVSSSDFRKREIK